MFHNLQIHYLYFQRKKKEKQENVNVTESLIAQILVFILR